MREPYPRSARIAAPSAFSRASPVSWSHCAAHWKGVCGFGTKPPIDTVHLMSRRPVAFRPASITRCATLAIASTSSSVSVGSPHMKYSLTCRHPLAYAVETVLIRSSSVTILLITLRIRSVPPSGAKVSPDRRPLRLSSLARVTLNASTRVEGSERPVFVPSYRSARSVAIWSISLWSALDSDSRPTSLNPLACRPASVIAPMVVIERSRTGLGIMPAWQNRQPPLPAVTEPRAVDERGDRLGVEGGMPAGQDDRVVRTPVGGGERDLGQVERGEQVGVAELGGEADAEHIEGADRPVPVDRELRHVVLAHQVFEVRPDAVRSLGEHAVALVKHLVKNLDALIRQAYLVSVRVHQRPAHVGGVPVLDDAVELAADVLDGLAHQRQQRLEPGVDPLNNHRYSLPTVMSAAAARRLRLARIAGHPGRQRPRARPRAVRGSTMSGSIGIRSGIKYTYATFLIRSIGNTRGWDRSSCTWICT